MLDNLGLVHMNGRIFDSRLGRFLSADPLIQAPENLQSFNRYSYVFNNPLSSTDPSGFTAVKRKIATNYAWSNDTGNLSENVSSTEISSQDNIGGNTTESSEQVNKYFTKDGAIHVYSTNRATEQQTGDKDGNPAFNQAPPTDLKSYGLASKEFMETGIDPAEGNHDKFAAKKGTPTEQYTQEGQVPDATATYAYQGGGNNTVSRATGTDPNYVPPSNYQPPVISAAQPGSRKAPEIKPMSANECFQTQHLTLGAPVSSPQMAQMNSTFITFALLGSAAPTLAPAIGRAAAPVITIGLQNAPQINQVGETVIRDLFDASGPSVSTAVSENFLPGGSRPGIWNQ